MFCHKCGAQVDDQAAFCDKCGAALQNTLPRVTAPPPPAAPGYGAPAPGGYAPPGYAAPAYPAAVQYAGFWRRFAASIIDGLIFGALATVIQFGLIAAGVLDLDAASADLESAEYATYMAVTWGLSGVMFLAQIAYFSLMESSSRQATLGKMVLGIVVTDYAGGRISLGRAIGRKLAKIVSSIILCIGYLMIAFTEKKQGLHDMIASTLVVTKG